MRVLLDLIEDNLQVASAVEAKLEAIVTRVPKGFAGSPATRTNSYRIPGKAPESPQCVSPTSPASSKSRSRSSRRR